MSSVWEGFNDRASGEKPGPDKDGSYKEFRPGRGVLRNSKEKTQDWHSDLWGFLTPLACPHCGKDGKEVKIRGYIETPEGGGVLSMPPRSAVMERQASSRVKWGLSFIIAIKTDCMAAVGLLEGLLVLLVSFAPQ